MAGGELCIQFSVPMIAADLTGDMSEGTQAVLIADRLPLAAMAKPIPSPCRALPAASCANQYLQRGRNYYKPIHPS